MIITSHAIVRYLERIEFMDFSYDRAICAAEMGYPSINSVTDGKLIDWMEENGRMDSQLVKKWILDALETNSITAIFANDAKTIVTIYEVREKECILNGE